MDGKSPLMSRLRRRAFVLPALIATASIAAYAAIGFLLVPYLLEREIQRVLEQRAQAAAGFERIRFNPFLFKLEAKGFSLSAKDGRPLLSFDRLLVDFEASSLLRWAWTFAEITLEGPRLELDIDETGELNLAAFVERMRGSGPASTQPQQTAPPRFLLQRIALSAGRVAILDRSGTQPARASLDAIAFELKDLSTLPDQSGGYALAARLAAGGAVTWRGRLALHPLAADGELGVQGLKLATLWGFFRDELLTEEPKGELDAGLRYRISHANGAFDLKADALTLRATGLSVSARGAGTPLGTLAEASLLGGTFDLARRRLAFSELVLRGGGIALGVDASGALNWQKIVSSTGGAAAPDAAGATRTDGAPWRFAIDSVRVESFAVTYADAARIAPLAAQVERVDLSFALSVEHGKVLGVVADRIAADFTKLRAAGQTTGETLVALDAARLEGGQFDLARRRIAFEGLTLKRGELAVDVDAAGALNWQKVLVPAATATPPAAAAGDTAPPWDFSIDAVRAEDIALRYADASRAQPIALQVGRTDLDLSVKSAAGAEIGLLVEGLSARLSKLELAHQGGREPLISLDTATLEGGRFDVAGNSATARALTLGGGATRIVREADGALNLAGAFAAKREAPPSKKPQKPFAVNVGQVVLVRHHVGYLDRMTEPPIGYDLEHAQARLSDVTAGGAKRMRFQLAAKVKQGGSVKAGGTFNLARARAEGRIEATRLALAPLIPLLERHATLKLASGTASASGDFTWSGGGKDAGAGYAGSAAIEDLLLNEPGGDRFLAWKMLAATGMRLTPGTSRLAIEELRLAEPGAKLVINKDRSVNLGGVLKPAAAPAAASPPAALPRTPEFGVTIDRISVERGELDFADLSLVLPFSTRIQELSGAVTGLSSEPAARASVKLEGRVEEYGLARVDGTISPFAPKAHTNLTVAFRNVMMAPLTPYSATFAGRRIASGRLSLDLQYKIENSQLLGENKVLLEKFILGERVQSASALNLPLDLAIALLTDAEGRIDIAVPVRGNVDNPEFSYGHLVWQAIRTVITNIVTAPFRALGALFGGSGEAAAAIGFDAGSDRLLPPEREKIAKLVKTLKLRPQLKLVVQGRHDAARDGRALRTAAARRVLAERLGAKPAPDGDPPPVAYDNAKAQQSIEALLRDRGGADAVNTFLAAFEKKQGREARRVNPVLAVVGRGSTDRELYEAMFDRVIGLQPLPESALRDLARRRAAAVARLAVAGTGLPTARVGLSEPGTGDDKTTAARLSLDVLRAAP